MFVWFYTVVSNFSRVRIDRVWLCCQSWSWSAEHGKYFSPYPRSRLRIRSRQTGSAVPSCVSSLILHELNLIGWCSFMGFLPLPRDGVHIYRQPSSCQSLLEFIRSRDCVSMVFTAESIRRHRASSPQGSYSNGSCLFRYHRGPFFARLSISTPITGVTTNGYYRTCSTTRCAATAFTTWGATKGISVLAKNVSVPKTKMF